MFKPHRRNHIVSCGYSVCNCRLLWFIRTRLAWPISRPHQNSPLNQKPAISTGCQISDALSAPLTTAMGFYVPLHALRFTPTRTLPNSRESRLRPRVLRTLGVHPPWNRRHRVGLDDLAAQVPDYKFRDREIGIRIVGGLFVNAAGEHPAKPLQHRIIRRPHAILHGRLEADKTSDCHHQNPLNKSIIKSK